LQKTKCCSVRIFCYYFFIALHDLLCLICSGEEPAPSNVAFGTTFLNRPTFPNDIAHDFFGNSQTPLRGVPNM